MMDGGELKQALMASLVLTLRGSKMAQKVDANAVVLEAAGRWNAVVKGSTVDLEPLYPLLMAGQDVTPMEAAEVCVLFKRREAVLGVKMKLPQMVQTLPASVLAELSGQSAPHRVVTNPQGALKPTAKTTAKNERPTTRSPAFKPVVVSKAAARAVKTLLGGAALVGVALAVNWVLSEKPLATATVTLPEGVPNLQAFRDKAAIYFYDPEKNFDYPDEEVEKMVEAVYESAVAQGATSVYFCLADPEKAPCRIRKAIKHQPKGSYVVKRAPPPPG
jgi:hypothetical protein